jgi:hypothetical protein
MGMSDLKILSEIVRENNEKIGKECPLRRQDPLYSAADAHEQADILAKKAEDKKRAKSGRGSSQGTKRASIDSEASQSQGQSQASSSSSNATQNKKRKIVKGEK